MTSILSFECLFPLMASQAISGCIQLPKLKTVEIPTGFTVLTVYSKKYDGSNIFTIAYIICQLFLVFVCIILDVDTLYHW